jgi:hypothetical protein
MNGTYKAVEVSTPGVLCVVERAISKPAAFVIPIWQPYREIIQN